MWWALKVNDEIVKVEKFDFKPTRNHFDYHYIIRSYKVEIVQVSIGEIGINDNND